MSSAKGLIFPTHFEVKEMVKVDQSAERLLSRSQIVAGFLRLHSQINHIGHSNKK